MGSNKTDSLRGKGRTWRTKVLTLNPTWTSCTLVPSVCIACRQLSRARRDNNIPLYQIKKKPFYKATFVHLKI